MNSRRGEIQHFPKTIQPGHDFGNRYAWRKKIRPEIRLMTMALSIAHLNNFLWVCKNSQIRARKIDHGPRFDKHFQYLIFF